MVASVSGPGHNYLSYKVQVIIGRRFKPDLIVSRPIRIYNRPASEIDYLCPYSSKVCSFFLSWNTTK